MLSTILKKKTKTFIWENKFIVDEDGYKRGERDTPIEIPYNEEYDYYGDSPYIYNEDGRDMFVHYRGNIFEKNGGPDSTNLRYIKNCNKYVNESLRYNNCGYNCHGVCSTKFGVMKDTLEKKLKRITGFHETDDPEYTVEQQGECIVIDAPYAGYKRYIEIEENIKELLVGYEKVCMSEDTFKRIFTIPYNEIEEGEYIKFLDIAYRGCYIRNTNQFDKDEEYKPEEHRYIDMSRIVDLSWYLETHENIMILYLLGISKTNKWEDYTFYQEASWCPGCEFSMSNANEGTIEMEASGMITYVIEVLRMHQSRFYARQWYLKLGRLVTERYQLMVDWPFKIKDKATENLGYTWKEWEAMETLVCKGFESKIIVVLTIKFELSFKDVKYVLEESPYVEEDISTVGWDYMYTCHCHALEISGRSQEIDTRRIARYRNIT